MALSMFVAVKYEIVEGAVPECKLLKRSSLLGADDLLDAGHFVVSQVTEPPADASKAAPQLED